jgi:hypothetical protein
MAPPKEIMGVTLPSAPPEDEPPLKRPRTSAQEAAQRPQTPTLNDWPVPSARPTESRKDSPAGGIKLEAPGGWKLSMPHAALLANLACFGGAGVAAKVASTSGEGDRAEVMAELRSIREELKGLRADVREVRDEQATGRRDNKKILNYVEASVTPIVAAVRRLGVKLEYSGRDLAGDVEFHATPMAGSNAPPIQPKAVLPERPSL